MGQWEFKEYNGHDDMNQSASAEAFEGLSKHGIATDLVREGIQNVLDARDDSANPARVRFTIGTLSARKVSDGQWFAGLTDHLELPDVGAPDAPKPDEPCRYLLTEDFNTSGLLGDFRAKYKRGAENNFVNFFYNDGITDKVEKNLGSRGVGKIVFLMASRARTLFGYTIRANDSEPGPLMVGKSLLKFREHDGKSYYPAGYFVESWFEGAAREPVSNPETLERFRRDFGLSRTVEPGLSIVIPYLDDSVTIKELRNAIIEEYYYAILSGCLVVELSDGRSVETISSDRLFDTEDAELTHRISLAQWAIAQQAPQLSTLAPAPGQLQKLTEDLVPDDVRTAVVDALAQHGRLAIRCLLNIHPRNRDPVQTFFDIYLEHAEDCHDRPTFIRELLPVSGEGERVSQVRAIVLIPPGPLADFLRAAEGANHTRWSPRTDNFKKAYEGRLGEIDFVKRSVNNLIEIARGNASEPVGGISTYFFSVASEDAKAKRRSKGRIKPGTEIEIPEPPEEEPTPAGYSFAQHADGFTIRGDPDKPRPGKITVRVAYDVIRGSPWSDYDDDDFDLRKTKGDVRVIVTGAEVDRLDPGNRLVIKPNEDDFEVTVSGFDPSLDLIIDHRTAHSKSRKGKQDAGQTTELHQPG